MFKKILLPTDGSEHAIKAAAIAAKLAKDQNARLEIINVVPMPDKTLNLIDLFPEMTGLKFEERLKTKGQEIINDTVAALNQDNIDYITRVELGSPTEIICEALENEGFDLVIIGSRGKSLTSIIMGSLPNRVAQCAPCPVMIVR